MPFISTASADFSVVPAHPPNARPSPQYTILPVPTPVADSDRLQAIESQDKSKTDDEAMLQDLLRQQQQMQKTVQDIQQAQDKILPVGKAIERIGSLPSFQYMKMATELHREPTVYYFYGTETIWLGAVLFFRAWRSDVARSFLHRVWIRFYTTLIHLFGAMIIIPMIFLDPSDRNAILELVFGR